MPQGRARNRLIVDLLVTLKESTLVNFSSDQNHLLRDHSRNARTQLERFRRRLIAHAKDPAEKAPLIVAFGDSVTAGNSSHGHFDFEAVYHRQLQHLLHERFSQTVVNILNAGVGGQTATQALKRLSRDIIEHSPDLVIVGFGLNDCGGEQAGLSGFRDAMQHIIE